jgi:hypothetical protein
MKRLKCARVLLLLFSLTTLAAPADDEGWIPLFNGTNLDGWYSFQPTTGRNNDPKKFFKVTDGMIHVLDLAEDPHEWKGAVGYLATNQEYSDVRIHLEYKWGTKRFARSVEGKRNSGLMYLDAKLRRPTREICGWWTAFPSRLGLWILTPRSIPTTQALRGRNE